jgi:hypothetical protein
MENKEFTREEAFKKLLYITYCNEMEINPQPCSSHEKYIKFLKDAEEEHCGDCVLLPTTCTRCFLQQLEIEAQNALMILWKNEKGHCGKNCLDDCEGSEIENKGSVSTQD